MAPKEPLHVFFFPHLAASHMISMLDIARLFAERGVRVSIAATHGNAFRFRPTVEAANRSGRYSMRLHLLPFPSAQVGLPEGCEDAASIVPPTDTNIERFYHALGLLHLQYERLLLDHRPDCVVADVSDNWTSAALGIPCLLFAPFSPFCLSVWKAINDNMHRHQLQEAQQLLADLDGLPNGIEMGRSEIPQVMFDPPGYLKLLDEAAGMLVNSFHELAPEYADYCCSDGILGGWNLFCVGPLFLYEDNGNVDSRIEAKQLHWLDSQPNSSVLYVCFGSEHTVLSHEQHREIALGLESSGQPFVWVVKEDEDRLPQDFEERLEGRGVIWRGWAPQLKILSHPAIGGFLTHCGWNSVLEAVSFGVPMIGWPLRWEQFINERFIVEVLGVGVRVLEGAAARTVEVDKQIIVKEDAVRSAVKKLMGDREEARAMKKRAEGYKKMARSATAPQGSSRSNFSKLIEELTVTARTSKNNETT